MGGASSKSKNFSHLSFPFPKIGKDVIIVLPFPFLFAHQRTMIAIVWNCLKASYVGLERLMAITISLATKAIILWDTLCMSMPMLTIFPLKLILSFYYNGHGNPSFFMGFCLGDLVPQEEFPCNLKPIVVFINQYR